MAKSETKSGIPLPSVIGPGGAPDWTALLLSSAREGWGSHPPRGASTS